MRIGLVDSAATTGRSPLHHARPGAKLLGFAMVLTGVVVSTNVLVVAAIALVLAATAIGLRLRWRTMFGLAAYPGLFAGLFALAASAGWLGGALIVAKAVTAALAAVTLVFTTPYPQIFAPVQRIVPGVLGDALLMTYRSLFLLLDTFEHTLTAVRLRAGLSGARPIRSARAAASSLGIVLLYSLDLSQRTYDVMRLRGYDGRLVVSAPARRSPGVDAAVVVSAAALAMLAGIYRVAWRYLNPYSWLPLGGAAVVLVTVAALSAIRGKDRS